MLNRYPIYASNFLFRGQFPIDQLANNEKIYYNIIYSCKLKNFEVKNNFIFTNDSVGGERGQRLPLQRLNCSLLFFYQFIPVHTFEEAYNVILFYYLFRRTTLSLIKSSLNAV